MRKVSLLLALALAASIAPGRRTTLPASPLLTPDDDTIRRKVLAS
jgi:hypothetical protein